MGNDQEPRLIRLDTCEPWERVIPEGITRIGRSKANEIQLEDTAVSRFHCFLTREGPIVSIHPGKSKNPARLNGEAVNGQRLKSGQTLIVGRCQFVFEEPLAAPEPSPNAPRGRVAALRQDEAPPPGHSAAPCEPEAVLASRLPRRRPSRTPKLVGARLLVLGLCVALLPTTIWLMLSSNSAAPQKASDGTNDEVAARRRDEIAELERRLLELTRHEEEYKRALNEESAGKVAELSKHIAELKSALAEAKEQNEAPPPSPSTTLIVIPEPNKDDLELSSVASVEPKSKPQRSSTTVVVPGPAGPVKRSPKELKALVAHLSRLLDDYATHTVFPETLEPELTELTSSPGKPAVEGILAVYHHSRQLLKDVEGMIESNRRRKEALLREAAMKKAASPEDDYGKKRKESSGSKPKEGAPPEEKEKKKYAYPKRVGPQVETEQRLLELSEKAMEIETRHRLSMLILRNAVLGSIRRLTDPEAAAELRERLVDDTDEDLALAIVPALEAANLPESIPALYRKISVAKDPELKVALQKALAALAGVDLGAAAAPWADWWAKRKSAK